MPFLQDGQRKQWIHIEVDGIAFRLRQLLCGEFKSPFCAYGTASKRTFQQGENLTNGNSSNPCKLRLNTSVLADLA